MNIVTAREVYDRFAKSPAPLLIHVLPPEHFAARRIGTAANACTYETAFVAKVQALAPDLSQPIIVYGEGGASLDSADAAEKLAAAGYVHVSDFRGGLSEWESAGFPVDGESPLPAAPVLDGAFRLDIEKSVIRWTGRNLFNHHEGTLKLSGGTLEWREGDLTAGELTIDMGTIACADLTDAGMNTMLIRHLRHTDFFDVENHPKARVQLLKAERVSGTPPGQPNFHIRAGLTIRGVEREIAFPAVIAAADADHVTAQAQMEFDRTEFGSRYGSGKFFAYLGQHVVNDHIQLHLKMHADRV